ncbi:MAG: type II secretion system F family protein [Minisyncoccia bacterium]
MKIGIIKNHTVRKSITFGKLSMKDQIFFVKRLSFLIKAGIPILESLNIIREQTKKGFYKKILDSVILDISNGQYLSTSLQKFRKSFGDFSINIISFGESTGILSENLEYLAEELRKKHELRRKIVGAMIYPIVVLLATFGIIAFLMLFLFPKITPIFQSIGADLPISTKIVMSISIFLKKYGGILLGVILTVSILISLLIKKSRKFKYFFDELMLKIPIVGGVIRQYNLSNSTRTIGLLLKSGITVSEALPITSKTTGNEVYKKEFGNIAHIVNKGEKISTYLKTKPKYFPPIMNQIVAVGERSGNLSNSLIYLSEIYESEVDDFTKNLSSMIEPFLMIFMGLLVGFIAISIITPIYSITSHLTPK